MEKMANNLPPEANKFHAGNGDDGKHYWLTPPDLYGDLNARYSFTFDPCPYPKPPEFDGLTCEWGASNYVNPPFGSVMHQGKKKGPTAWARKAIAEAKKGKRVVLVYPIDKWVLMLLAEGAKVRNLGDVRWLATEDGSAGKGTGRHIAEFALEPRYEVRSQDPDGSVLVTSDRAVAEAYGCREQDLSEQDKPLPSGLHHMPDVKPAPPVAEPAMPEPNMRRVIRAARLCAELGHASDTLAALEELKALRAADRAAKAEALPCGHPKALMLHSAETGEPLYCELCDDKSGRRDAELRESELQAERDALRTEVARLTAERDALLALVARCRHSMRCAVEWQKTGEGRPPSQTCMLEIDDALKALDAARTGSKT